jgi:Icc-related predicted phosphoesterase
VPEGDVLVHSGDATITGTLRELQLFNEWFAGLPHKYKIFVAGNHDWLFEQDRESAESLLDLGIIYLQDSSVELEGFKVYGAPWQPRFFDWAFNLDRGAEMAAKWQLIPDDTQILITHGPPHGILDAVPTAGRVENAGCEELRARVEMIASLGRLKMHLFGHIHCGYGTQKGFGVTFVNASTCDEEYRPTQPPIVIDL